MNLDPTPAERLRMREEILKGATEAVMYQRNKSYGEPDEDFQRIAGIWNSLGFRGPGGEPLKGHHVSMAMIALKLSRLTWNPTHQDSWMDTAGYAACGYETAVLQEKREATATLQEWEDQDKSAGPNLRARTEHCLSLVSMHEHDDECFVAVPNG